MTKLFLLRHFQSEWNKENKFTGWTDVPLSPEGVAQASNIASQLAGERIDEVFTSPLERNRMTSQLVMENLGKQTAVLSLKEAIPDEAIPIYLTEALNERSYGEWTGLNKNQIKEKIGEERFNAFRRGWDEGPPGGESLKDVYERAVPFFKENIEPKLKEGKNILVVASHNSLRSLVKYLENIKDEEISSLEISSGGLLTYQVDEDLNYSKS